LLSWINSSSNNNDDDNHDDDADKDYAMMMLDLQAVTGAGTWESYCWNIVHYISPKSFWTIAIAKTKVKFINYSRFCWHYQPFH